MFIVLIDTSAFEKEGLAFSGPKFDALKQFSLEGKIKLIYSSITIAEINRHIEESLTAFANAFKRLIEKEADHIAKTDLSIYSLSRAELKGIRSNLISHRLSKVVEFFSSVETVELIYDSLKPQHLVSAYLNREPPFSEKKPFEFPDAIVLNALVTQFEESLDKMCVVSSDADFKKFCKHYEEIKFFNEISEFTDFINSSFEKQLSNALRGAMNEKLTSLAFSIEQSVYDRVDFIFNDDWYEPEAEIEEHSVTVEIKGVRLLSSDTQSADWELDFQIKYRVFVTDQNLDSMVKDSDTKEWIIWETSNYRFNVDKFCSIEVSTTFDRFAIETSFEYDANLDLPDDIYDLDGEDLESVESVPDIE